MTVNPLWADEEVNIDSDELLDPLPKKWECTWKDQYYTGKATSTMNEGNTLKKIVGTSVNEDCPALTNNFTGKVKKGKVYYKAVQKSPCVVTNGTDTLYRAADGSYYWKGEGRHVTKGYVVNGTSHCVPK